MVFNNEAKFHKILFKSFRLESGRRRDRRTDGQTGVTFNTRAIIKAVA